MNLDAADGGQRTGLAGVTVMKTGWILKEKMWSWAGDDYAIFEVSGSRSHPTSKPVFKVSGKALGHRDAMLFRDADGTKIAYLCQTFSPVKPTYKLFTFAPNYDGQKSTDKQKIGETEFPLYSYAKIESKMFSFKGIYYFKRYTTNEKKVDVWDAKGNYCLTMCLDVRKSDTKEVVAQVGQASFFQPHSFETASQ